MSSSRETIHFVAMDFNPFKIKERVKKALKKE